MIGDEKSNKHTDSKNQYSGLRIGGFKHIDLIEFIPWYGDARNVSSPTGNIGVDLEKDLGGKIEGIYYLGDMKGDVKTR